MRFARAKTLGMVGLPLLAAGLGGCRHKAPPPTPQVSTAPPLPPSSMTQTPAVPKMPPPAQPKVGVPGSDVKAKDTQPAAPTKPRRSKRHPAAPAAEGTTATVAPAPPAAATQQPGPAPTTQPAAPTLGELALGTGTDSRGRAAMYEQIRSQELRLGKIKQPLSEEDKAIAVQVQTFLAKAKQAVSENDLDGAQTLTTKAKVLLDELSQS